MIALPQRQKSTDRRKVLFVTHVICGTAIMMFSGLIYFVHPFYRGFLTGDAPRVLEVIWILALFLFTAEATLKYTTAKVYKESKYNLIFFYLYSKAVNFVSKFQSSASPLDIKMSKEIRTAFLSIVVKFFYIPIMIRFATGGGTALVHDFNAFQDGSLVFNFDTFLNVSTTFLFFIDTTIFGFGYLVESSLLKSEIKSVEPTLFGWVVALATYPPFNSITGQFLPMHKITYSLIGKPVIVAGFVKIIRILIILAHVVFVLSTISLGFKSSNLTNRGIVSRGPYSIVRHPAYTAKITAWGLEGLIMAPSIGYFLSLMGFGAIYGLRALTEERHLSEDPDYLAYKKKVRFKFIPYIY